MANLKACQITDEQRRMVNDYAKATRWPVAILGHCQCATITSVHLCDRIK